MAEQRETYMLDALQDILATTEIDMDDGDLALEALSYIRHFARVAVAKATREGT